MDTIDNLFSRAWRDNVTDGVLGSGEHDPDKREIRPIGRAIDQKIATISAGIRYFATKAVLDAYVGDKTFLGYVYADGKFYAWDGDSWEVNTSIYDGFEALVQDDLERLQLAADAALGAQDEFGEQLVSDAALVYGLGWSASTDSGGAVSTGSLAAQTFHGAPMFQFDLGAGAGNRRVALPFPQPINFVGSNFKAGDVITTAIVSRNLSQPYPENAAAYQFFQYMQAGFGGIALTEHYDLGDGYRIHYVSYALTADMLKESNTSGGLVQFLARTSGDNLSYTGQFGAPMVFRGNTRAFLRFLNEKFSTFEHSVPSLAFVGHSFVEGASATAPDKTFAVRLGAMLGLPIVNLANGGQTDREIAANFGAIPITVSLAGNMVPESGPVAVSAYSIDAGYHSGFSAALSVTGVLFPRDRQPIAGTLVGKGGVPQGSPHGSGQYDFLRATPGDAAFCPTDSLFVADTYRRVEGRTLVMMVDKNSIYALLEGSVSYVEVVENILAIIRTMLPRFTSIFVLEDWNLAYEGNGTAVHEVYVTLGNLLERVLGNRYVRTRRLAIDHGLAIAGIAPNADDSADIARDEVPRSLREPSSDPRGGIHPNDAGHLVIATICQWAMQGRGF